MSFLLIPAFELKLSAEPPQCILRERLVVRCFFEIALEAFSLSTSLSARTGISRNFAVVYDIVGLFFLRLISVCGGSDSAFAFGRPSFPGVGPFGG